MAWQDLTFQEQEDLAQAERFIRGLLSTIVQSIDLEMQWWTQVIDPIMAQLLDGDVIPNSSALAGAQDLTKLQLQQLKNWLKTDVADKVDTNIALVVLAIGINAGTAE